MLPAESAASARGCAMLEVVAGPSTEEPKIPVPAAVLIVWSTPIFRKRWSPLSATYQLPVGSAARPHGSIRKALVAGPWSPSAAVRTTPANTLTVPPSHEIRLMTYCRKSGAANQPAGLTATSPMLVMGCEKVLITPLGSTIFNRPLLASAMKTLPLESTATPAG